MKEFAALASVAFLAMSACTPDVMVASSKPASLTSKDIAQIEEKMRYDMFDPNSAMFRNFRGYNVVFQDGHTEKRACFEVNGKNRMGGYVGFDERAARKTASGWEMLIYC